MASQTSRTRRDYGTPGVVSGNLARKLDQQELERQLERSGQLDFDQQYHQRQETQAERLSRQRARAKAAVRPAQAVSPVIVLGFAAVAVMLMGLLMSYVRLNAISRDIVDMKEQISELEIQHVALMSQYERAFDLTTVKAAAEEAGMTTPSDSQIYYIHLPGEDRVVAYGDESRGVLDAIVDKARSSLDTVVSYFR